MDKGSRGPQAYSLAVANLGRIEFQSMQLCRNTESHVSRTANSIRQASSTLRNDTSKYRLGRDSEAIVELYLAKLGFNLPDQQRLIHQISAQRTSVDSVEVRERATAPTDLDSFLSMKRSEGLVRAVEDAHRMLANQEREETDEFMAAMLEKRKEEVADSFGLRALSPFVQQQAKPLAITQQSQDAPHQIITDTNVAARFARVIESSPPKEWLAQCSAIAKKDSPECAGIWRAVESIMAPVFSDPSFPISSASTALTTEIASEERHTTALISLAASSRSALETAYINHVLKKVLAADPSRLTDLARMHKERFKEIVAKYCSLSPSQLQQQSTHWPAVYVSMRCGRYDTAALFAMEVYLSDALRQLAALPPTSRNCNVGQGHHMLDLYQRDETRLDPCRSAVLLVLLGAITHETDEELRKRIDLFFDFVKYDVSDLLWLRLSLIRYVQSDDPHVPRMQCLVKMQLQLELDQQTLLQMVKGNLKDFVIAFFHAGLNSSAIRILSDNPATYVDAVHLAIIFDAFGLLAPTPVGQPFNLNGALQRYATLLLGAPPSTTPSPPSEASAASSIFFYFLKTNRINAFVELCQNPVVCTKLFGRPDSTVAEGELLLRGTPPTELLDAMEQISAAASSRGTLKIAVHVLLALERLCSSLRDTSRARISLQRAIQYVNPEIARALHPSHDQAQLDDTLAFVQLLKVRLASSRADIPLRAREAFGVLCDIAQFYSLSSANNFDAALRCFFALPFVPSSPSEVEHKAQYLNSSVSDDVLGTLPHVILTASQLLHKKRSFCTSSDERFRVQQSSQALRLWLSKWRVCPGREALIERCRFDLLTTAA